MRCGLNMMVCSVAVVCAACTSGGAKHELDSPAPRPAVTPNEPQKEVPDPGAMLDAPASTEQLTHPFSVNIQGQGTQHVGAAAVSANVVSVEIDGLAFQGVVQKKQAWADFSLTLYQSLLVSQDDVRIAWFYCKNNLLTWVYHEGSRSPMRDEPMQGSCASTPTATTASVRLPAVAFTPPAPLQGYRVDGGERIQIHDGADSKAPQSFGVFDGERYRLYPFERVDCSKECGQPGWHEIHALMERERDDALGFIIIYLREPAKIEGHYSITWPGFDVLPAQHIPAEWTTP